MLVERGEDVRTPRKELRVSSFGPALFFACHGMTTEKGGLRKMPAGGFDDGSFSTAGIGNQTAGARDGF